MNNPQKFYICKKVEVIRKFPKKVRGSKQNYIFKKVKRLLAFSKEGRSNLTTKKVIEVYNKSYFY